MRYCSAAGSLSMVLVVCAAGCTAPDEVFPASTKTAAAEAALPAGIAVYYFHRTMRCPACLSIEESARDAVESNFPQEVADGTVQWHALNMEHAANEPFVEVFRLDMPALIVERIEEGGRRDWRNLTRVWDLLDDPGMFAAYVRGEIETMLSEPPSGAP